MLGQMDILMAPLTAGNLGRVNPLVSALNTLVRELYKAPDQVNPSPLRTITHALDFLRASVESHCYLDELEKAPLKVLLVDDDRVCRSALAASLRVTALAPTACGSAQEALEVLRTDRFDVIFTDVMMAETDGFEFCSQVRNSPDCPDTPVIFVTCLTDVTTRSLSELAGGHELMTKPWMRSEMILNALTSGLKHRVAAAKNQTARQEAMVPIGGWGLNPTEWGIIPSSAG
jgi:CheY-like chemotaxis protein